MDRQEEGNMSSFVFKRSEAKILDMAVNHRECLLCHALETAQ